MKTDLVFQAAKFAVEQDRCDWTAQQVLASVPADKPVRILDLGCGTGGLLFSLAPHLPLAEFVGLDISAGSIEEARAEAQKRPQPERFSFHAGSYLDVPLGTFDFIVSDTVLHLIDCRDRELFGKIRRELKPGGRLICTMPFRCSHNALQLLFRRTARLMRGRFLDGLILWAARVIYGNKYSTSFIQERVMYMYIIPFRLHDPQFVKSLARDYQLVLEREERVPNEAMGKLSHKVAVYRNAGGEEGKA
jgi:SAM-dependent methyltransferase